MSDVTIGLIKMDMFEYRDPEGLVVLGIKFVLPGGKTITHGETPDDESEWKEPLCANAE
jgi:hypothetical protein